MLEIGMKIKKEFKVNENQSALSMGSGDLLVLATPCLLAFVENTCKELVAPELEEGSSTVGISVSMTHDAPTKIGDTVVVEAELVEINKRILTFKVEAHDSKNTITKATHTRCVINVERFMNKVNA